MTGNTETEGLKFSRVLNKIGDYAKTNFVINWASGVVIIGAITASVIYYQKNESLKNDIETQKQTIEDLKKVTKAQGETINTINITFETMKSTVEAFKANPPSTYDEKINGIYRIINIYHNNNTNTHNPPTFHSVVPNVNNTINLDTNGHN